MDASRYCVYGVFLLGEIYIHHTLSFIISFAKKKVKPMINDDDDVR